MVDNTLARLRARPVSLKDQATTRYVHQMQKAFPEAVKHRQMLQALGCDFSYARQDEDGRSWIAIVELNGELQQMLGCSVGLLAYYSPYRDLQTRTVDRLRSVKIDRKYENHIFLLSSPDVRADRKIGEWTLNQPFAIVTLRPDGVPDQMARNLLLEIIRNVSKTNPYERTSPVVGNEFYGRRTLLQQLVSELRHGRVCGVFGLRKTGKTSLITELGRQFVADDIENKVFVLRDLEVLPSEPSQQVPQLCSDLSKQLHAAFKRANIRTHELSQLPSVPSIGELRQAVQASLTHESGQGKTVVLALDEIESLVGPDATTTVAKPLVAEFFGALRSLVQEIPSFNVVISGITVTPLRNSTLYGRENPLFAWAKPFFVSSMPDAEAREMIVSLGARMAVRWAPEAVGEVLRNTGGHVFLTRSLAGAVADTLSEEIVDRRVLPDDVRVALRPWKRNVSTIVDAMIDALERFYPLELDVLRIVADEELAKDAEDDYPAEIDNLLSLGLLVEDASGLRVTPWVALGTRLRRQ